MVDLSYMRGQLPQLAQKYCLGKPLIGLNLDVKKLGHQTDEGIKFFFMNDTESYDVEDRYFNDNTFIK